ncbi:MAG: sporulation protein YqfD, partial [Oscillospiraceae bacterium]|nr:sporulation protein YqfD [Oscillospiraceae bacterium]
IEIKGNKTEEFLNICAKKRFDLFQIEFGKDKTVMSCLVTTYKQIQKLKIKGLNRKIIKKRGIRFTLHRYRKRAGLLVGSIMMVALLIFLSGFVWNIDVTGNERLSTNVILQTLEECGFCEGERKSRLDISEIENQMMMRLPDLSWISINLDGSFAHIEVKERTMPPVSEDVSRPSNLVASMDGQIIKMEIVKGKPMVVVGSGVVKGELLVAGLYNDKKDNIIIEHSSGKVLARTELKKTFELSLSSECIIGTEQIKFHSLEVFGQRINFSFGKRPKGAQWQRTDERKRLSLFGLDFPFYLTESCYTREIKEKVILSETDAKNKVKMEIEHYEKSELYNAQIVEKHITWTSDEENCRAKVDYIIITDIAQQQYIDTESSKIT